tara:strand:- start:2190 stop:2501 length:312 start_codon:yes stop_codon:yes gene_type:complete
MISDNLYTSTYLVASSHDYFKPEHFENLYGNKSHRWMVNLEPDHMDKLYVLGKILQHRYPKKLTRSRVLILILNKVFDDLRITRNKNLNNTFDLVETYKGVNN